MHAHEILTSNKSDCRVFIRIRIIKAKNDPRLLYSNISENTKPVLICKVMQRICFYIDPVLFVQRAKNIASSFDIQLISPIVFVN